MCKHDSPRFGSSLKHGAAHRRDHARWTRRDFLSRMTLASAGAAFSLYGRPLQAFANVPMMGPLHALDTDRILVLIQLSGGNDGLNMVVPVNNDIYYQKRPTIAIPKAQALLLDGEAGLHPAMNALLPLWDNDRMAVIHNVGYPSATRSHFEGTVNWATARDQNSVESTGWLGRYFADTIPGLVSNPPEYPLAVRVGGPATVYQSTGGNLSVTFGDASQFDRFVSQGGFYDDTDVPDTVYGPALSFVRQVTNASFRYVEAVQDAAQDGSNQVTYPDDGFAQGLSVVARMVRGGLATPMYMVSLGSFDTHSSQGNTTGNHASLLERLADAIAAFLDDLAQDGLDRRVMLMTFSEFGRTLSQNGSGGTDHGAGAPMMAFGTGLRGGTYGTMSNLTDLYGGDPLFTTDYRSAYSTVLQDWLGVAPASVDTVMNGSFERLGFVADALGTGTAQADLPGGFRLEQNYPNPFNPETRIQYTVLQPGAVNLAVYDVQGRHLRTLVDGTQAAGTYAVTLNAADLPTGTYLYRLSTPGGTLTRKMVLVR